MCRDKKQKRCCIHYIKLNLADMAYILGTTEQALRKRIQRDTFKLPHNDIEGFIYLAEKYAEKNGAIQNQIGTELEGSVE